MTTTEAPKIRFDIFYKHDDLTRLLFEYAQAFPTLAAIRSIGKSYEGRDIWVATITNVATGAAEDKPAFWTDGNIHAAELTASTAVLYFLNELLTKYGSDAEITQLLDTRAVYLCPRLNPDGAELALADRPRHIRSSTRRYPYDEEPVDGLTAEDIDGDGRILFMRVADPHGTWKKCEQDPRLMVARQPGEFGGEYFRLMPEGLIRNYDGLTIKVNSDLEGLDLNRNFPSGWRQEHEQVGAGDYPTSEPEVKAMVDFIVGHKNIGAAISYHTHSGVILQADGHRERRRHDPGGPVVDQALQRDRRQAHGLPGDQHLARLQVPPEGRHQRHPGLGLRAPRRAVLGGRDLGAEQGSRDHRLQVDRLVPRAPGRRRPQAHQVERRALRRPGPRRLEAVHAPAARRRRDRRLGQDELLAQSAARTCASARRRASRSG